MLVLYQSQSNSLPYFPTDTHGGDVSYQQQIEIFLLSISTHISDATGVHPLSPPKPNAYATISILAIYNT